MACPASHQAIHQIYEDCGKLTAQSRYIKDRLRTSLKRARKRELEALEIQKKKLDVENNYLDLRTCPT
eukprot:m.131325 g.131325  ORF g.131325 m.131325 type:complete len:68 (-) comp14624_c0_seq3:91-294(-)